MPRIKIADLPEVEDRGGVINRDDFVLNDSRLMPLRRRIPGAAALITRPERALGHSPIVARDWDDSWGNAVAGVRG